MDVLPEAIVQLILSNLRNAKDVARCSCVCWKWKEAMSQTQSLFFPRDVGDEKSLHSELIVTRMVLSMASLKELVVYCPYSHISLLAWLSHTKSSLRSLELRVDELGEKQPGASSGSKLDCVSCLQDLRSLRLWGVLLNYTPKWRCFESLTSLEIIGARLQDSALSGILGACPTLVSLTLLACDGVRASAIELELLKKCRLDFYGMGDCSVTVVSPALEELEVQGASYLNVVGGGCLRHLTIGNNAGKVKRVDIGKLSCLESLTLRGVHWCWRAIDGLLQMATELKELSMRVEFCGDTEKLEPFPEMDFAEFFGAHPKLRSFESHGALFAALSQRNSLKKVSPDLSIELLERASIMIRSPLNADCKVATLEALLKCSPRLKKLTIRVLQMKNCGTAADEFFVRILALKLQYGFISIE